MICLSIANVNVEKCIDIVKEEEFAEIRIDLMDLSENDLKKIFSSHSNLIATCRPGNLDDSQRISFLKHAMKSGAAYVDLEVDSSDEFKEEVSSYAKKNKVKTIVSFHNYEKTPSTAELEYVMKWCSDFDPDIIKIATKVNSEKENARLLSLLDCDKKLIIIGMGELGKISRVIAPQLGSFCTYASVTNDSKTADGQFTREELKEYMEMLNFG